VPRQRGEPTLKGPARRHDQEQQHNIELAEQKIAMEEAERKDQRDAEVQLRPVMECKNQPREGAAQDWPVSRGVCSKRRQQAGEGAT
jgi:hypothetical protein